MHSIKAGSRVTLHFRIASGGNEIVDTFGASPETIVLGQNEIDPRLEWMLQGLAEGEHHTYHLDPVQAFGERNETLVKRLPRSDFPANLNTMPGQVVEFPMPNGQIFSATLVAADAEIVTVDFNHPLAGKPVEFEVQVLSVEQP